ncbi:hypothetical protein [Rhodopirellula sp. SWK7]|uniref:hypothetical protein n=1 Tax=Rhodopirellula sp. SWK7 TaxID=595460 RepID=UPI0011818929|nr:hypothetical protein [Rhodopirellula sp. SWK7]
MSEPTALTSDQLKAIELIESAGGVVVTDESGMPISIDLVGNRVFADVSLVRAVLGFPKLRKLLLGLSTVPAENVVELRQLGNLDELMLQDASISDDELGNLLSGIPKLRRLTLRRPSRLTDVAAALIDKHCPDLEVLAVIEMNQLTGKGVADLSKLAQLRALDLRNCNALVADDFRSLRLFGKVRDLKIGGPQVDDTAMELVAMSSEIVSLSIEDAAVSAEGLKRLAEHEGFSSRLQSLQIVRSYGVTDEALTVVTRFPNLKTLALRTLMITGGFLDSVAEPLPLETLILTDGYLTDQSIEQLPKAFPKLKSLNLRGNSGVSESNEVFRQMKSLTDLRVTKVLSDR